MAGFELWGRGEKDSVQGNKLALIPGRRRKNGLVHTVYARDQ